MAWSAPPKKWWTLKEQAHRMRNEPTPAEAALWKVLRKDALGVRFRRQQVLGGFIADFYSWGGKLVIEVDGGIHDQQIEDDASRSAYLEKLGLRVLRFCNEDILNAKTLPGVVEAIRSALPLGAAHPVPLAGRGGRLRPPR